MDHRDKETAHEAKGKDLFLPQVAVGKTGVANPIIAYENVTTVMRRAR